MVFTQDGEPERLLAELQRIKERDSLTVFAFVVMGNHHHLALRTSQVPLDGRCQVCGSWQRIALSLSATAAGELHVSVRRRIAANFRKLEA